MSAISGKSCITFEKPILRVADGSATNAEIAAVEAHLAECRACTRNLELSRRLTTLLAAPPSRQVSEGFERRLFAAIEQQPPQPSRSAWWERLRLHFEWRLRVPALVMSAGLATAMIAGVIAPNALQTEAGRREVLAAAVEQHKQLESSADLNPDAVDAGIALATGSFADALMTP